MNNKGFAVSSILYTILICFLLFLGAALAMFSSSNSLVVAGNDDLVNGTALTATPMIADISVCNGTSFQLENFNDAGKKILIKISSRYGVKYWPRDFLNKLENGKLKVNIEGVEDVSVKFGEDLTISDEISRENVTVTINNPCE